MKQLVLKTKNVLFVILVLIFSQKVTGQVLHVDYVQTAGTSSSFTVQAWVSKTSPEPMLLSALNTVFTYPNGTLVAGAVNAPLVAPFNTLQTLAASYISPQLKIRATQVPSGSPAASIEVTETPQLFCTFTVTSSNNIVYPLDIIPATGGNPTVQAIVYHNGLTDSQALTLIGGTITIDENPLTLQLLPIKLHDFSAEKLGDRDARLYWNTSSEINSSHFIIERSMDAQHFEPAGRVEAFGQSSILRRYEFIDRSIPDLRTSHIVYYRLRMVDLDGSFEFSDIRGVNFGKSWSDKIRMYPNPTADVLNIDVEGVSFEGQKPPVLSLINAEGKMIMSKEITGNGIETIDMSKYAEGVYQIFIQNGNENTLEKIIRVE